MSEVEQGVIKVLKQNGYGFLEPQHERRQVFFHANSLAGCEFDQLSVGDPVSFIRGTDAQNRPSASVVRRI